MQVYNNKPNNPPNKIKSKSLDEHILVVKRNILFKEECWQGIKLIDCDNYLDLIKQEKEFHPRSEMETDQTYKQIIPYLVFKYEDKYFLMQRQAKATEQRLKSKYSLGIGGHIREEDLSSDSIIEWARREFEEEVNYNGLYTVEPVGILNDDTNEVGKVHAGFVFLLKGDSPDISVKSELKSGKLLTLSECKEYYDTMETWTQIVVDFLNS